MPGMQLRSNFAAGGSYTPLTPASAQPSTSGANTIAQKSYGINGSGGNGGSSTAAVGSVSLGMVALVALVYLWWSLPR
jgi:hypothetical protein